MRVARRTRAGRPTIELVAPPTYETPAVRATRFEIALRWAWPLLLITAIYVAFSLPL